jgi:hypothetical protein
MNLFRKHELVMLSAAKHRYRFFQAIQQDGRDASLRSA